MNAAKTGALIAQMRKEKGLTQRELADRCGINYRVVNDGLTGRNRKEENIRRIRETLAIPS